jgi:hypothetical protein
MNVTQLRDKSNNFSGKLIDEGGHIKLYDKSGNYAGRYDKQTDRTMDKSGMFYGKGNLLVMLLNK